MIEKLIPVFCGHLTDFGGGKMGITKKFVILIAIGILLLCTGYAIPISLTVFILYNLLCMLLLIIDYFTTPDSDCFSLERIGEESLNLHEESEIGFRVQNNSVLSLYVEIRDEIPDFHFKMNTLIMRGVVEGEENKDFIYKITPTKRGIFMFGKVHLKYMGRLKLCTKQFSVNLKKEFKVFPGMKNLRKYRMAIYNNRILQQGQRNMRMLGRGTAYESLREYVTGDEYRKINCSRNQCR